MVKDIIKIELISLTIYSLYLLLRSFNSAATSGGAENFMDIAMLSAAGKTHYFPFIDPWYAGKLVNYYYYGSYLSSLVSNLSNTSYVFSYSFMLGIIYCQSTLLVVL